MSNPNLSHPQTTTAENNKGTPETKPELPFEVMSRVISAKSRTLRDLIETVPDGVDRVMAPLYYPESKKPTGIDITCSTADIKMALVAMQELNTAIEILQNLFYPAGKSSGNNSFEVQVKRPEESEYFYDSDPSLTYGCREVVIKKDGQRWASIITRLHPKPYEEIAAGNAHGNGEVQLAIRFDNEHGPEGLRGLHVRFDDALNLDGETIGLHFDIGDTGLRRDEAEMHRLHQLDPRPISMKIGLALALASICGEYKQTDSPSIKGECLHLVATGPASYHHTKIDEEGRFRLEDFIKVICAFTTKPQASYGSKNPQIKQVFQPSEALTWPGILEALSSGTKLKFPDRVFEILIREALLARFIQDEKLKTGARILDLGGGSGKIAGDLTRKLGEGSTAVVVDSSSAMLTGGGGKQDGVYHCLGEMADLDLFAEPGSIDFAMSLMAMHYLSSEDFAKVFQQLTEAMADGGMGLFTLLHPNALKQETKPETADQPSVRVTRNLSVTEDEVTEYAHWPEHIVHLAQKAGFMVETHTLSLEDLAEFAKGDDKMASIIQALLEENFVDSNEDATKTPFYERKLWEQSRITFVVFEKLPPP